MIYYLAKRILFAVITLFVILLLSYVMLRLAPGDPTRSNFMGSEGAGVSSSEKQELSKNEALRRKLKLDKPVLIGFCEWFGEVLQTGDFGTSGTVEPGRPVTDMIMERLPVTVKLNLLAMAMAYSLAIPLGVWSAKYAGKALDVTGTIVSFLLYSLPVMWVGLLLQAFFCAGGKWPIFPLKGIAPYQEELGTFAAMGKSLIYYFLPAVCLAYGSLAGLARYTRAGMLEILGSDFVRTARAKGLSEHSILWVHAFRNTLITLVTLFSGLLPSLIAGSIIVEHIFSIPGMGTLSLLALSSRDYPLQMALFAFSGALTLAGLLLADLCYTCVDPRVRLH